MSGKGRFAICFALLAFSTAALAEQRTPGSGGITFKPLVQPQSVMAQPAAPSPYPMTYSEQAAHSLGLRDGGVDLARPSDRFAPSLNFNGSMLRLQWRH
ncbi:MAG: hypothetical protein JO256_00610 [Alphaproteobacteria bacterium]|nr:hypothetical protein [Alphaproteobacteria bacterium]